MERELSNEFQEIIKTIVAPNLKAVGFKKNKLNFNRTFDRLVQSINVQRSQYNHADRFIFTINLGFYNGQIFKISRNRTDEPKFVTTDNCFVWGRSGHLIYNKDYWYELTLDVDFKNVSLQVENDLKIHIIPLYDQLQTLNSILELLRTDFKNRPYHLIASIDDVSVLELEFGDFQRGKEILVNIYKQAIIPKSAKHTTVYPDGREEVSWSEPGVNQFHIEKLLRIAQKYKIEL